MNVRDLQLLFEYNVWADRQLLAAAARVEVAQFFAPADFPHGSLHEILVHILGAKWIWRTRLQDAVSPTAVLKGAEFPTFESIRRRWEVEDNALAGYLASLRDEDLISTVRYANTKGQPFEGTLWHILVHLFNHNTQHRSEAAALLSQYGCSPGDLDLILFLRT
jgi:uncharacterized damage-inducible protein DinB